MTRLRLRSAGATPRLLHVFLSADATVCRDGAGSERLGCRCVAPAEPGPACGRLLREGGYAGTGRGVQSRSGALLCELETDCVRVAEASE